MDKLLIQNLIDNALKVREKAYVPYSKFPVGASILFKNFEIFTGCNIENASLGATNCAEKELLYLRQFLKAIRRYMRYVLLDLL